MKCPKCNEEIESMSVHYCAAGKSHNDLRLVVESQYQIIYAPSNPHAYDRLWQIHQYLCCKALAKKKDVTLVLEMQKNIEIKWKDLK